MTPEEIDKELKGGVYKSTTEVDGKTKIRFSFPNPLAGRPRDPEKILVTDGATANMSVEE